MQIAKKQYERRKKAHLFWMRLSAWFILLASLVCFLGLNPMRIAGSSMFPSIINGDLIMVSEVLEPQRFDIVSVRVGKSLYCKRLVGMPGDLINLTSEAVIINGVGVEEYYLHEFGNYDILTIALGPNEYFVMGDNRNVSLDSRSFGPVGRQQIESKMLFRVWRDKSSQSWNQPQ